MIRARGDQTMNGGPPPLYVHRDSNRQDPRGTFWEAAGQRMMNQAMMTRMMSATNAMVTFERNIYIPNP